MFTRNLLPAILFTFFGALNSNAGSKPTSLIPLIPEEILEIADPKFVTQDFRSNDLFVPRNADSSTRLNVYLKYSRSLLDFLWRRRDLQKVFFADAQKTELVLTKIVDPLLNLLKKEAILTNPQRFEAADTVSDFLQVILNPRYNPDLKLEEAEMALRRFGMLVGLSLEQLPNGDFLKGSGMFGVAVDLVDTLDTLRRLKPSLFSSAFKSTKFIGTQARKQKRISGRGIELHRYITDELIPNLDWRCGTAFDPKNNE